MAENQENAFVSAVEEPKVPTTPTQETETNLSAENTLNGIAVFTLIVGIIGAIVCLFTICWVEVPKAGYTYLTEKVFSGSGFATTIGILIGSLATWALLKVIANISITLKEINKKIK